MHPHPCLKTHRTAVPAPAAAALPAHLTGSSVASCRSSKRSSKAGSRSSRARRGCICHLFHDSLLAAVGASLLPPSVCSELIPGGPGPTAGQLLTPLMIWLEQKHLQHLEHQRQRCGSMSRSSTLPYPVELYAPIMLTLIELIALVPELETAPLGCS